MDPWNEWYLKVYRYSAAGMRASLIVFTSTRPAGSTASCYLYDALGRSAVLLRCGLLAGQALLDGFQESKTPS